MSNSVRNDSFLKGTVILAAAGILIKILGAFFRIPLGNLIGSVGMGYYQCAYPIYALFLTLATAGFPTAVAKIVSERAAIGDERGAYRVFKLSHLILFLTGVVMFCILFFGAEYIATDIQNNPDAVFAIRAIAPALLVVPSMSVYRGYYQGKKHMEKIAISQIVEQLFRVTMGLVLAFLLMKSFGAVYGAAGGIAGATIGSVFSLLYLLIVYLAGSKERKRAIENSINTKEESKGELLANLLKVAIPISIGAAIMPLVNMIDTAIVINRLMVAGFTRIAANSLLGQMSGMAMAIVNLPMVLTTAMGMALVPSISQAFALKNYGLAKKDSKIALKVTILLVLPCAFGLASLATPIMSLLYPAEDPSIGMILFTLAPGTILLGLLYTMNGILQGMGKPMVPVYAIIVGIIGKVITSYTLTAIPEINILGSALGTVLSYLIAAIIEFWYIKTRLKISTPLGEFIVKPLFTVSLMYAGVKLAYIGSSMVLGGKLATLVGIAVGGIIYVVVLLKIGGITKEEIYTIPKGKKLYSILVKLRIAG